MKIVVALLLFLLTGCETLEELVKDVFYDNTDEILLYLQKGDKEKLKQDLTSYAACRGSEKLLQENMLLKPVYFKNEQGDCALADVYADDQRTYFSNKSCNHPVSFMPTAYQVFCNEIIALDKSNTVLGNAAIWEPNDTPIGSSPSQKWTIPLGARMKLTIEPIKDNTVPYMKRVNYKTINNIRKPDGSTRGNGSCKLEMRVYKKDISATNLQPLVSIHGGSWKLRTAGFPGLESSISHYTEQGFIVFVPFYRLTGNKEANAECNNASWQDMVSDVEDALKWVWRNGETVGAEPGRSVALMGQSAGAHLATWLLTHPERHSVPMSRALLLYPPADLKDFVAGAVPGGRYASYIDGIKTVKGFFGVDEINKINMDALAQHAFPGLVRHNPATPPVFIIHGVADNVVPSMLSVRLCNAYEGGMGATDFDNGSAMNDGGDLSAGVYMRKYDCGSAGKLHLFAETDHAFDLKCIPNVICMAGSENTIPVLKESLKAGRQWLMGSP
ncbi:MAG: alpha/beta hydrolase [Gammaproteobacteria bacterium]